MGNVAGRIWQDACDYGFWIKSQWTDKHMLFTYDSEDRDNEGELTGYVVC